MLDIASEPIGLGVPVLPYRLPFLLPDFTRIQWASEQAKQVWAPRISSIVKAWSEIERWSVADGARASTLQVIDPKELPALVAWAAAHGCVVLPLGRQGQTPSYSSTSPAAGDTNWVYRVAVVPSEPEIIQEWINAWNFSNNLRIGRLLGFPNCCQQFFEEVWVKSKCVDTTFHQAAGVSPVDLTNTPVETNLLWRWMGVRMVPHLPCSHHCEPTIGMANNLGAVAKAHGFDKEWAWTEEILSWPVEWSALHGIALVTTPIMTVSTRTDATSKKLVVRRQSNRYPLEGASGTGFPYRVNEKIIPLTSLKKFKDAFKPAVPKIDVRVPSNHEMNGFASLAVQTAAHDLIAAVAGEPVDAVLDLGCGNGQLARTLSKGWAGGVEKDTLRAAVAYLHLDAVKTGDISAGDWPVPPAGRYDLLVVMPGRLIEMGAAQARILKRRLDGNTLLIYAYGDWLDRYGSLEKLTRAAGLPWNPTRSRSITSPMRAEAAVMEI